MVRFSNISSEFRACICLSCVAVVLDVVGFSTDSWISLSDSESGDETLTAGLWKVCRCYRSACLCYHFNGDGEYFEDGKNGMDTLLLSKS